MAVFASISSTFLRKLSISVLLLAAQNGLKEQVASKSTEIESLRKKVEEMEAKTANRQPPVEESRESASR